MVAIQGFWPLPAFQRGSVAPSPSTEGASSERTALRIVIVDDNYDANVTLSRLLELSGFEVAGRAYDGLAGLKVIQDTHPDVAILDIEMPALDGLALAGRVKAEVASPPHLVALTGFGNKETRAAAASAGFEAYFCKPADWPALRALLDSYRGQ